MKEEEEEMQQQTDCEHGGEKEGKNMEYEQMKEQYEYNMAV